MKKLFFLGTIFVASLSLMQCTTDNGNYEKISAKEDVKLEAFTAFNRLSKEIVDLNNTFFYERLQTRSWFGKFWKGIKIVSSDVLGGIKYGGFSPKGIIGGIASSAIAFAKLQNDNSITLNLTAGDNFNSIDNPDRIDSVGLYHNKILLEIYNENPELFDTEQIYNLITVICAKTKKYYPEFEKDNVDCLDIAENTINLVHILLNSDSRTTAMEKLEAMYPDKKNEFEIMKLYLDGIENIGTKDELLHYTNQFKHLTETSNIPENSKKSIKQSLSISLGSYELWSKVE